MLVVDDDILCLKLVAEMLRRCMIYEGEAAQADLGGALEAAGYCLPGADGLCFRMGERCSCCLAMKVTRKGTWLSQRACRKLQAAARLVVPAVPKACHRDTAAVFLWR